MPRARHGDYLNRPDAMNAINGALSNGLWTAIQELDTDDSGRRRYYRQRARFCAGMDLKALREAKTLASKYLRSIRSEQTVDCCG